MITATDLSWSYGRQQVLDAVDLATRPGRVLGLIGPNGSGKTTLLRLLYGSLNTPQGTVRVDGTELRKLTPRQVAARLAVVVQESSADSALSVAENVLLGRTPHLSSFARIQPSDQQVVATVLSQVGAAHLAARQFTALSGGERQRVLIARALGRSPRAAMAIVFLAVLIASFAWSVHSTASQQEIAYFDTFTRLWEFAAGSLLGLALGRSTGLR